MKSESFSVCFLFRNLLSLQENSIGGWVFKKIDSVNCGTKNKFSYVDGEAKNVSSHTLK